ncbi:hypothetical protein GCM10009854_44470 [Saccharopolyspora halophila]|uniref:Secreted protein n=1 Tax=Saccharopolyspora halophila TaxID=405551 RepID=A0ABP5TSI6_9PSEU
MRILRTAAVLLASGALLAGTAGGTAVAQAPAAQEQNDQVLVFILDKAVPVKKFKNPEGCYELPVGTHVVINDTPREITLYATPGCDGTPVVPGVPLEPGRGAHDSPAFGSFKA